jgi:sugar lactone lactonase YvrE
VAVDGAGNIYVADETGTAYRFDSSGTQTLAILSTGATPNLATPFGIAAAPDGSYFYVADMTTNVIHKFNAAGAEIGSIAPTAATPNLSDPQTLALDSLGNLYVAVRDTNGVNVFDPSGVQILFIAPTVATPNMSETEGVAVGAIGTVYASTEGEPTGIYGFCTGITAPPAPAPTPVAVQPAFTG